MEQKTITELLEKIKNCTATPAEEASVKAWLHKLNEANASGLSDEDLLHGRTAMWQAIYSATTPRTRSLWPRIAAAASILFVLSFGGYYLLYKQAFQTVAVTYKIDIAPALHHATLTLANGQQIALTKTVAGKLAQQGNTAVAVLAGTGLTYSTIPEDNSTKVEYNTLTTVRGEQAPYPLQLADGTKIWLNAASSITFPVAFNGNERKVTVTGEAYFEVVHNGAKPFRVSVKDQTIEDIGTHFNINAYDDEAVIKTTLFEGSVSIAKDKAKVVLKPGQQGITAANISGIKVNNVDTEEALAWKKGRFYFEHETLQSVMRKISRWYDVDVQYPTDQTLHTNYWGRMSRETNISVVLNRLAVTNNVRFIVDGKKVIVLKK
ncbi:FecR family protein [Mucilaginibacter sp. UYCu711]|uniref:FecR family protein n=1 Tax=Mucilaginibacter sp. UYCu711 TaxID=3156339 RepID=UPI003D1D5609